MGTITKSTYDDYIQTNRKNFTNNFRKMIRIETDLAELNRALEAADSTFGYTHAYGDEGYVEYHRRRPEYLAIVNALDASRDNLMDDYYTANGAVVSVLATLSSNQRAEITSLVESFLTTD